VAGISEQDVAKVYAKALLAIAGEQGAVDSLLGEFEALTALLKQGGRPEAFLTGPLVDTADRAAVIEKAFRGKASDLLVDALQVINRKGRSALLPAIAEAYRLEVDRAAGRVDVSVATAVPLSETLRESLKAALRNFSGREPILHERVDASLIAGMVVQVGDDKFDTSASSALERLEGALFERASREIMQGESMVEG
jgi:F-type H+-transporting ATPase subunit delta